ncbi:MAG TPA: hypothetical protein VFA96_07475 [Nocardioides sp.]|nr:hypothetical protein [Nocardioides sp.]
MTSPTSVFGFRTRARVYSVGAIGLSVAGVVGFFSNVGSTVGHAAARPITTAKAAAARHEVRTRRTAPSTAASHRAPSTPTVGVAARPVPHYGATQTHTTTYTAPAAAHVPAPAPSPAAPKPVTSAPKPVTSTPPTTTTPTPPPTQTHSS